MSSFRYTNQPLTFSNQTLISENNSNSGADEMKFSLQREDELKGILIHLPHEMRPKFDKWVRALVKEEIELSCQNQAIHVMPRHNNIVPRNLELRISNISSPLYTGDQIKDIGGTPVTVTLIDSCTKEEVNSGPEASGKVDIVVIEAEVEDSRNVFECKLVCHIEGKKVTHVNRLPLRLMNGTVVFPKVSFSHNSTWMKISKVRLQVRFVDNFDGVHVKEAQTEPFMLSDRRNEANAKHPIPSLDDDVWRLYNIKKKGTLAECLINAKIKTVGDFIVQLFLHPQRLKEIFDAAKLGKKFNKTVEHARKCPAILKYSCSFHQNTEVIFNVSGEVLGLYQGDSFLSTEKEVAKKLVVTAFNNWPDVIHINKDQVVARCIHLLDKNMLHDEEDPNPQFLPEFSSTRYDEFYHGFEAQCTTSIQLEPEKNGYCKIWRKLVCVVTFTRRSLDDLHAHKKRKSA
ncbi:putative CALMODULIN-BINDING PROTEIN60 [Helianthus debilis subsp. tardiflorus]